MKKIIFILFLIPIFSNGQENPLAIFKPLEQYIWSAEGKWGDGSPFKQEISFNFSLDDNIVIVDSKGFTNTQNTTFGLRNHGIRQYDKELKKIKFWEFDIFGNVTEGTVTSHEKNLIYTYDYGGTSLTEMWIYKNEKIYNFIVGVFENGDWTQKFLETEFKRKEK